MTSMGNARRRSRLSSNDPRGRGLRVTLIPCAHDCFFLPRWRVRNRRVVSLEHERLFTESIFCYDTKHNQVGPCAFKPETTCQCLHDATTNASRCCHNTHLFPDAIELVAVNQDRQDGGAGCRLRSFASWAQQPGMAAAGNNGHGAPWWLKSSPRFGLVRLDGLT